MVALLEQAAEKYVFRKDTSIYVIAISLVLYALYHVSK
jgi:hypothetical protein